MTEGMIADRVLGPLSRVDIPFTVQEVYGLDSVLMKEAELSKVLQEVSDEGISLDPQIMRRVEDEITDRVLVLQSRLDDLAGRSVNVRSTAQLKKLLTERGLVDTPIRTPKGEISVSTESLLYMQGDPIIDTILELKHESSVQSSIKVWRNYVGEDNRIHPEFLQVGEQGTSRMYTTNPALNQWTWEMREAVVPDEGNRFLFVDWTAAELYIALKLSGEKKLSSAYERGEDIHSFIASLISERTSIPVTREDSKVLTFATIYGSRGEALERKLRISDASRIIEEYEKLLKPVFDYEDLIIADYRAKGYVVTPSGRIRVLEEDPNDPQKVERQAVSTVFQGACADLQKRLILNWSRSYRSKLKFKFTVFDSFLFEIPDYMTEEEARELFESMMDFREENCVFKFKFKIGIGADWLQARENLK